MSKNPFNKFINKADSGSKKKERIRQEKKKARAEKNAWFEEKKKKEFEDRNREKGNGGIERKFEKKGGVEKKFKREWNGEKKIEKKQLGNNRDKVPGKKSHVEFNKKQGTHRNFDRNKSFEGSKFDKTKSIRVEKRNPPPQEKNDQGAVRRSSITEDDSQMPLNKFIAWSGVCARREAAEMVKQGRVTVNSEKVTEPAHRVSQRDEIRVNGKKISIQKNLVYILLNKPKDYITTTDDPEGRRTVMELIRGATTERVFPVGRLDRNTTGVLLLTNDGELAQKLTHPSYEVKKLYEVRLDRVLTRQDFDSVLKGITLEDGFIKPDALAYADTKDKSVIGIEIHSGRNRIVRRIFEQLGYKIKNLDRVMYGNFTKKNVDRGKWRYLNEKEIRLLKHMYPRKTMRHLTGN